MLVAVAQRLDGEGLLDDAQLAFEDVTAGGWQTYMNDADRGVMNYTYDDASNLIKTVDAKNQEIRYAYDGANRLLNEDYRTELGADPTRLDVEYHYDIAFPNLDQGDNSKNTAANVIGKLAWVKDLSGEEHTSYDNRGNAQYVVKRIPDPVTGVMVTYKTAMAYDSADRVKTLTYPDLDTSDYEYDARSLVKGITGGGVHNLNGNDHILASCTYLPSGQRKAMAFGNSVQTTYAYDKRMRLNDLAAARAADPANPLMHYGYEFDRSLNITKINDLRPAAVQPEGDPLRNTQTFTYDDLDRLTSVKYSFNLPGSSRNDANDGRIDYRYDQIGNMLSQTSANLDTAQTPANEITNLGAMTYGQAVGGTTGPTGPSGRVGRSAGQAPGPHALTNVANGSRVYPYDDNGNMTNIDGLTCTWDFLDRMTGAETASMKAEYTYDYTGRRISKKVWNKTNGIAADFPTLTTLYINQNFEVREGGQPTKYVFLGDTRIARIIGTLNPSAQRMQRIPLSKGATGPGWNLVALCVDTTTPSAASQMGIGTNASIGRVYKWNATTKAYDAVTGATALPRGTILWVEALANLECQITGSYSEPGNQTVIPDGSRFATNAALLALSVDNLELALKNQYEYYGPYAQTWATTDRLKDGGQVPDGVDFVPVGAAIAVRTPKLIQVYNTPAEQRVNYYVQDHLSTTGDITDASGSSSGQSTYFPCGVLRSMVNNIHQAAYSGYYSFIQKEQDSESHLSYFEGRFMKTGLGRFVNTDPLARYYINNPIDAPQYLNPYSYCLNNSINMKDVDGLKPKNLAIEYVNSVVKSFNESNKTNVAITSTDRNPQEQLQIIKDQWQENAKKGKKPDYKNIKSDYDLTLQLLSSAKKDETFKFEFGKLADKQYRLIDPQDSADRRAIQRIRDQAGTGLKHVYLENTKYTLAVDVGGKALTPAQRLEILKKLVENHDFKVLLERKGDFKGAIVDSSNIDKFQEKDLENWTQFHVYYTGKTENGNDNESK